MDEDRKELDARAEFEARMTWVNSRIEEYAAWRSKAKRTIQQLLAILVPLSNRQWEGGVDLDSMLESNLDELQIVGRNGRGSSWSLTISDTCPDGKIEFNLAATPADLKFLNQRGASSLTPDDAREWMLKWLAFSVTPSSKEVLLEPRKTPSLLVKQHRNTLDEEPI